MTRNSVKRFIAKHHDIIHSGIAFNLTSKWFKEYQKEHEVTFKMGQAPSWDLMLTYINEDPETFKQWIKDYPTDKINRYLDQQFG